MSVRKAALEDLLEVAKATARLIPGKQRAEAVEQDGGYVVRLYKGDTPLMETKPFGAWEDAVMFAQDHQEWISKLSVD